MIRGWRENGVRMKTEKRVINKLHMIFYLLIVLLLFLPSMNAITSIPTNQLEETLKADIQVEEKELRTPFEEINIYAEVENPTDKKFVLYLLKEDGGVLKPIQTMGVVDAYSIIELNLTVKVEYPGRTRRSSTYALALSDEAGTVLGKVFILYEDWGSYESIIAEAIARAHILVVPVVSLISLLVLMILIESAYHRHIKGLLLNEYTMHSLFFPKIKGRPYEERIADVMLNPLFWVFEIALLGVLFYFIFSANIGTFGVDVGAQIFLISGLSAFLFPLIYLGLAWFLEAKPLRFLWSLFLFGAVSALVAFVLNTVAGNYVLSAIFTNVSSASLVLVSAALVAPLIEETVKSIGVFIMSGHHEYNDILTGLMFGFAVGIGFSFVENWFYFASKTSPFEIGFLPWIQLIIYRSFFNSLAHGTITATAGALIGYLKSYTPSRRYIRLGFVAALLIAIPLHALFNISALLDSNIKEFDVVLGLPFIFNPLYVVFLTVIFVSIYFTATHKRFKKIKRLMYKYRYERKA